MHSYLHPWRELKKIDMADTGSTGIHDGKEISIDGIIAPGSLMNEDHAISSLAFAVLHYLD